MRNDAETDYETGSVNDSQTLIRPPIIQVTQNTTAVVPTHFNTSGHSKCNRPQTHFNGVVRTYEHPLLQKIKTRPVFTFP